MPFVRTALLAAAASLLAVSAFAQTDPGAMPPSDQSATPPAAMQPAPPAADSSSMPPPADASAPVGAAADTSATVDANGVVWHSAQPIPDTPANRAADGQPLSHAGKVSPPIGN